MRPFSGCLPTIFYFEGVTVVGAMDGGEVPPWLFRTNAKAPTAKAAMESMSV